VSSVLTFSTKEEFFEELNQYYPYVAFDNVFDVEVNESRVLNHSTNLVNSTTVEQINDWDSEESYNSFYNDIVNIGDNSYTDALTAAGYTRTTVNETI